MGTTEIKPCSSCNGEQWIRVDNLTSKPCKCLQGQLVGQHLGQAIATSPRIRSPLFIPSEPSNPDSTEVDRTQENLFLKTSWTDLLPHLRWSLGCKYNLDPTHSFLVVTDERLLQIWLGSESYTQRSRSRRDEEDTYNNLADLVNGPKLLIIRLGFLGYPNKAAPGVLKQSLGIREVSLKPTWLIEDPTQIFGPGHHAYNEEVEQYLLDHFDIVDLRRSSSSSPVVPASPLVEADDDTVTMGSGPPPGVATEERIRVSTGSDFVPKKSKDWNKPGFKKKSGGGLGGLGL